MTDRASLLESLQPLLTAEQWAELASRAQPRSTTRAARLNKRDEVIRAMAVAFYEKRFATVRRLSTAVSNDLDHRRQFCSRAFSTEHVAMLDIILELNQGEPIGREQIRHVLRGARTPQKASG